MLFPEGDHLLLIENVAGELAHQGQGLGRLLLDFAEVEARRLRGYLPCGSTPTR